MAYLPLRPIPIKERNSMIFVGMGRIDVRDGAFVVIDEVNGERMHIPVGSVVCIMLEPGTRISHAAIKLAATTGTLLIWVGEAGVRLYSAGQPGGGAVRQTVVSGSTGSCPGFASESGAQDVRASVRRAGARTAQH